MNAKDFLDLMGEIDGDLIVNAKQPVAPRRAPAWRKLTVIAAAACLLVGVLSALVLIGMQQNVGDELPQDTEAVIESPEESPQPDHGADFVEPPNMEETKQESSQETAAETIEETTPAAPPVSIGFDSMDKIAEFLQAANGSAEEWDQYLAQNLYQMSNINHTEAKEVADRISGHVYPFIKEGFEMEGFGADIVPSYEEDLDVRFKVNGSTTRFIYYYDRSDLWNVDGELVIEDVPIYNTTIDLYYGERWANGIRLYGPVVIDGVMVNVVIFLEDGSEFSLDHFDCFEFRQIGS